MADPKTVAGGVAVVAIGGGAGYGISQAVDNKKESSSSPQPQAPAAPTVRDQMKKAGFEGDDAKQGCKAKLDAAYVSSSYEQTVKDCVKDKKFETKAGKLGLTLLIQDADKSKFDAKWTDESKKTLIKELVTETASATSLDDTKKGNILSKCQELKAKEIDASDATTIWSKFLKICIDESGDNAAKLTEALNKDFWTGEVSSTGK